MNRLRKESSMRVANIVVASVLALSLSACGSNPPGNEATTSQAKPAESTQEKGDVTSKEGSTSNALLADSTWPENEATSLIPEPKFSVPLKSVNVSESETSLSVSGNWSGVTQEEFAAYVQSLKDAGFTVNAMENKSDDTYFYSARNAELSVKPNADVIVNYFAMSSTSDGANGSRASVGVSLRR